MMGWKGAVRSYNAAVKRAEKEAVRQQKLAMLDAARSAVQRYEDFIEQLTTLHHDCTEHVDWTADATAIAPVEPMNTREHEVLAQKKLDTYKPNFLIRLLKLENWMRSRLAALVVEMREVDERLYRNAHEKFVTALTSYKEEKDFAERILRGDLSAYEVVIKDSITSENLKNTCKNINLSVSNPEQVEVLVKVLSPDFFPTNSRSLLKSGKLSEKPLPVSKFNSIYQDYVCSALLKIAQELFAVLPIDYVVLSAVDDLLDRSTGRLSEQAILSVMIPRDTLARLNMQMVDPSDALRNFKHNIEFKATAGFSPVEKLSFETLKVG